MGKSWYVNSRKPIGVGKVIPVPSTLDWNLWQGPAPRMDYKDNIVHYNWHWRWNWGTGESCNNGNHELDCLRWFMDADYATKVTSAGGRYAAKDDWETPDLQIASFEFGDEKVIIWEGRSSNPYNVDGNARGFIVYGDKRTIFDGTKIYDLGNKIIKEIKTDINASSTDIVSSTGNADIYDLNNFIESIRGNAKLTAPIADAHKSVLLCYGPNSPITFLSSCPTDLADGDTKK